MTSLEHFKRDFATKKVLVFGLGLLGGGVGVAQAFAKIGAKVCATDLKTREQLATSLHTLKNLTIDYHLGGHQEDDISWADVIIQNPSVPANHPLLKKAFALNKIPVMDKALYARYTKTKIVGITGTRGKTTTTLLIQKILTNAFPNEVLLGGNATHKAALELLWEETPKTRYSVLELSSWDLAGFHQQKISPPYGVLTNIYPDHLNRYSSMAAYIHDKKAIFAYQKPPDHCFINQDNPLALQAAKGSRSKVHYFSGKNMPKNIDLPLKGAHNRQNYSAALSVVDVLGVKKAAALKTLQKINFIPNAWD